MWNITKKLLLSLAALGIGFIPVIIASFIFGAILGLLGQGNNVDKYTDHFLFNIAATLVFLGTSGYLFYLIWFKKQKP